MKRSAGAEIMPLLHAFACCLGRYYAYFCPKAVLKDYARLWSSVRFFCFSVTPSLLYSGYMAFVACASFLYTEAFAHSFHDLSYLGFAICYPVIFAASLELFPEMKERNSLISDHGYAGMPLHRIHGFNGIFL